MLGIGFFKGQPTEHVIKYVAGRPVKVGPGLAFYYWKHKTQIVAVPTATADANFVFNEVAGDFQDVTLQGQFTYRITDPDRAAELLNFTIDPRTRAYVADSVERVLQRIANVIQTQMREELRDLAFEDALKQSQAIATRVCAEITEANKLDSLGAELLGVHVLSAKPTPEVATALETEYRESLLQKADEATYARRADAVEMERKIKENELNTEIALEEQRERLIDLK
ncbi:MAG TPA: SPFH domain-containing protein, partial [Armatimonadota bacterium]|nr:SPFH domain-containing protein [Armatimonadota bacterium]